MQQRPAVTRPCKNTAPASFLLVSYVLGHAWPGNRVLVLCACAQQLAVLLYMPAVGCAVHHLVHGVLVEERQDRVVCIAAGI